MQIKMAISGYDMIKRHRKKDEEISPLDIYKQPSILQKSLNGV